MPAIYQRSVDDASGKNVDSAALDVCGILTHMQLGERIIRAYEALGLSQAEAARRCGMSAQRFGNYVKGKRRPDIHALVQIAEALNTTPDDLLSVSEPMDQDLADILGRLLELEGLDPQRARTIAEAASATHQLLKALPDDDGGPDRRRLAAQAVWSAQRSR